MATGPQNVATAPVRWSHRLEYAAVRVLVWVLGALPLAMSRRLGLFVASVAFHLLSRLRQTGLTNLSLAYPEWTDKRRSHVLKAAYGSLGRQLVEFCRMSAYTRGQAEEMIDYDGLEHYLAAHDRGAGVLVLTGHLGAWELSSFSHSLRGYPMGLVIRRLDNPLVDAFVNRVRCLHGNRVIHKDDFARGLISAMRAGQTVGILMDTNMTPPQGVFVPYFGRLACTATAMARIALKTGAAVLPGFLLWDEARGKYRLWFGAELPLSRSGDMVSDILTNTAAFTAAIEAAVRRNPEQWLWMHRRWKTRPPGEAGLYS